MGAKRGGQSHLGHGVPKRTRCRGCQDWIEAAKEYAARHGCKQVTAELVGGDPAKRIVQTAKDIKADLVVMGSRGLGNIAGVLKGSVSHKVNHLAPCTCVTVT